MQHAISYAPSTQPELLGFGFCDFQTICEAESGRLGLPTTFQRNPLRHTGNIIQNEVVTWPGDTCGVPGHLDILGGHRFDRMYDNQVGIGGYSMGSCMLDSVSFCSGPCLHPPV